jgi:hypothetical protein
MTEPGKFAKPIKLRGLTIASLDDIRAFMDGLSETDRSKPHWREAADLFWKTAAQGDKYDAMFARSQFVKALKADGLILRTRTRPR